MSKLTQFKLFLLSVFLIPTLSWAQSISGKIVDQENNPLEFAAVAVINSADSILISYASTDRLGDFELIQIPEGNHIFQVHLIGFKTYQKMIEFKNEPVDIGSITLEDSNLLDEVVVTAIVPISIKQDTVAYNTNAFKIRVDDTVEDLLKKLPGVEVDAAGKVTAQGEEVTKIYVDGKEFFGGDPAIALKNLSADAIKSVEVVDEKSESARVTGVNDTERNKVINLTLKDDKKVNDFGKVQAGYGTDDRYLTSLNYNRFTSKIQASVIGKFNNVNTSGSDISEIITFNTGGGGGFGRFGGNNNSSSGFVTTGIAGVNFGYEFKKDQNLNTDYFFNHTDATTGDVYTNRTEFIGDEEIKSESRSRNENITNRHRVNFSYRDRSNKLSSLDIRGSINHTENEQNSVSTLDKYNGQDELDLQSIGGTDSKSTNGSGNVRFDYTKRFNEESKRSIRLRGRFNASSNSSTSNNNQLNKFNISDPAMEFESKQDIKRDRDLDNYTLNFEAEYTEPIAGNHFIDFNARAVYEDIDDSVDQTKN